MTTDDITDATSVGKTLLKAVDAAAQRTALGLGTAATQSSGTFAAASHTHSDYMTHGQAMARGFWGGAF